MEGESNGVLAAVLGVSLVRGLAVLASVSGSWESIVSIAKKNVGNCLS